MQVGVSWQAAGLTVVAAAVGLLVVVALTRAYGLRSFAKMAPFDFAATIAIGSALAATAAGSVPLLQGLVALTTLYGIQRLLALWRRHGGSRFTDNDPLLLMVGERVLWDNMASGQVTEADLLSKLREANVLHLGQVRAVVLEGTGDIAVLHGDVDGPTLQPLLVADVTGLGADGVPPGWREASGLRGDADARDRRSGS